MNCKNCNATLSKNDKFCKNCGTAVKIDNNEENNNKFVPSNNQNVEQPVNQGFNQSMNQGFNQPMNQGFNQPMNQGFNQPMNQGFNQSMNQGFNQSMNQGFNQSMNQGVNQPMNQTYGQTSGYTSNYNNTNKKSDDVVKYVLFGVVGVILLCVFLFGILGIGKNKIPDSPSDNDITDNISGSKVSINGFELTIPDNLEYEMYDGQLYVYNQDETWRAAIEIVESQYSSFKQQKSTLASFLGQQFGYKFSPVQVKTVNGMEFLTSEFTADGYSRILAICKANYQHIFVIEGIMLSDYEYDYSFLEEIISTINSNKYIGGTASMSTGSDIDLSKVSEFGK